MPITSIQIGSNIYPLVEGEPIQVKVGETIRVFYSFKYMMPEADDVAIWASLYKYTLGVLNRSANAQTKSTIPLEKTTIWKDFSGSIDITIGSISGGTYGLIVELPGRGDAEGKIDDCVEVEGATGIMEIIPAMIMIMMMGMIMPMMDEGMGGEGTGGEGAMNGGLM